MTKQEAFSKLPYTINHPVYGFCERRLIVDSKETKGINYEHKDGGSSYGRYGNSWEEVYLKLVNVLKQDGLISD